MQTIIYKSDGEGVTAIGNVNPLPVMFGYDSNKSFTAKVNTNNALNPVQIKAGATGKTIYVTDLIINSQQATRAWLEDGDGTELTPIFYIGAATPLVVPLSTPLPVTEAKDLMLQTATQVNISVLVNGLVI